ncbi:RagB/SusD family nutrient uptake outer membrane protein [Pedobacter nutrimenti]|uniref:RagB/SusD family nutrient uptake outer membrane protein n=1 Tax=Pedobacter nutrimenti TaxID=1241337 RepID=UPI00292D9077|nr:RagB/SusD family nutrient uptake outer membrane protein [Pedobacter nutrimenti]
MKYLAIKIFGFMTALLLVANLLSCKKYLDAEEYLHEVNNLNDIWNSRKDIRQAWAACYGDLPNFTELHSSWPFSGAGDEGHAGLDTYAPLLLSQNKYNSDNLPGELNYWTKFYKAIRTCNLFLENSHLANDKLLKTGEVLGYQADVRFLRAYYYSLLLEIYGPFVIVDKTVDYASGNYPTKRASLQQCVDFLVAELDKAGQDLPRQADILSSDLGRPSKAVAMATKARILLWAASPLVNGNPEYNSFVDSEGKPFFGIGYDQGKWAKAAAAYKEIINLNQYQLFTLPANNGYQTVPLGDFPGNNVPWPNGPANIDPYRSFKALFSGGNDYWNSEVIWQVSRPNQNYNLTALGWPRGHKASNALYTGRISVTQKIVDGFFMNNGRTIEEENQKLYKDVSTSREADGLYILGDGSNTSSPVHTNFLNGNVYPAVPNRVLNREARFYATIGFHGRGFKQDDKTDPYYYVDYRAETADGYIQTDRPSVRTGYSIVKYINDGDMRIEGSFEKQYPVYRLAEVYLSYAEALNETEPGNPDILKYLNLVRYRAGLPGYSQGSKEDVRKWIKRERLVELAFEGKRYFDMRRWKDAEDTQRDVWGNSAGVGGSVYGMNYKVTDISFYDRTIIDGYSFKKKNYFFPLPYVEVSNHWGELIQNPGW